MPETYDFTQVDALKKKLDDLRPLDAELFSKLRHKLQIEWTYNSNAIEGNPLGFGETRYFLEYGLTSKGKPLSAYLEMKNHKHALEYLEGIIRDQRPLSETMIKELHAMLFENNETYVIENEQGQKITTSVLPGAYKKENTYVLLPDGSRKTYMDPWHVPEAMEKLIAFYAQQKETLHSILLAAEIHARFVAIHPFVDGNGRVARLILNIILMQAGYQPAILQNEHKQEYYDALRWYDERNDIAPFVAIVEQEVIRTLQITLNAAEGKGVFSPADITKRLETFGKTMHALEKDVGKTSKIVSKEKKEQGIINVRNYLYSIAKEKIEGYNAETFSFETHHPVRLEQVRKIGDLILSHLEEKNIVPDLPKGRSTGAMGDAEDFLPDKDGSAFVLAIKSKRAFIPNGVCWFTIIPTKYTLCACFLIWIPKLERNKEGFNAVEPVTGFIENGVLWEDWNKSDLDHFFSKVFEQFLELVQEEAERRKVQLDEKKAR